MAYLDSTAVRPRAQTSSGLNGSFVTDMEQIHGRQLRRFLSSRLGRASADVPDLVQETLLRLLRVKDCRVIRNPQAYLFTVASHVLREHALKKSMRPELLSSWDLAMEARDGGAADPADELEFEQRLEQVRTDLMKISPRAYATLLMYRCEGMTLMEIGERFGVSHAMVRKYLARAIAYCDERLESVERSTEAGFCSARYDVEEVDTGERLTATTP